MYFSARDDTFSRSEFHLVEHYTQYQYRTINKSYGWNHTESVSRNIYDSLLHFESQIRRTYVYPKR